MNRLKITVLVENQAGKLGVLAEHGLAYLIQTGEHRVLMDCGQGFVLQHNLQRLALSLADVQAVALSHGHYDHSGGLQTALERMPRPTVYAHPFVTNQKFARNADGSSRSIGMPDSARRALARATWVKTETPTELPGGVHLTGFVPRQTDFEDAGGPFFRDEACTVPDPIDDDQSAFIETPHGTVVILGCAHAGIINTLHYILELTDRRPIHTVIGGMHLHRASKERMNRTVAALQSLQIRHLIPCHCTGFNAAVRLRNEFPERVKPCSAGTILSI